MPTVAGLPVVADPAGGRGSKHEWGEEKGSENAFARYARGIQGKCRTSKEKG